LKEALMRSGEDGPLGCFAIGTATTEAVDDAEFGAFARRVRAHLTPISKRASERRAQGES